MLNYVTAYQTLHRSAKARPGPTGPAGSRSKRKQELLQGNGAPRLNRNLWWGLAMLGFTSLYREGFEVVLFLLAHQRLPYRRMLVLTDILLGGVLLVMVGEQAQEMQLAHRLPKTDLPGLADVIRPWILVWRLESVSAC